MTASEIAAIVVSVAVVIIAIGLLWALSALVKTLQELRLTAEHLRTEAVPLLGDLRVSISQANQELTRVDGLLETAESISGTVDSASKLAYLFLANPVVKVLAAGAGTARAARRLRRAN